jgi:hypothetical protein
VHFIQIDRLGSSKSAYIPNFSEYKNPTNNRPLLYAFKKRRPLFIYLHSTQPWFSEYILFSILPIFRKKTPFYIKNHPYAICALISGQLHLSLTNYMFSAGIRLKGCEFGKWIDYCPNGAQTNCNILANWRKCSVHPRLLWFVLKVCPTNNSLILGEAEHHIFFY